MSSSDSNKSTGWPSWLKACVVCLPKKSERPTYPEFHAVSYNNAQSGPEPYMMGALPERIVRSDRTARVEYGRNGQVSTKAQRPQHLSANQSQGTLARPGTASSANTTGQRFPVNSGNVYGNGNADPRDRWSKAYLTPHQLSELLDNIHATLAHIPYAICGLAALNDYGYFARRLNAVSLVCPTYAKDNVHGWLRTKGYDTYDDYFGIPVGERGYGGEGATVYRVRVKWVNDEGFAKLERVKSSTSDAWVLGLTDQIDYAAMGFMHQLGQVEELKANAKKQEEGPTQAQAVARAESRLRMAAQDILWCLDKAARTRHRLDPEALPTLLGEECWTAFTTRFERARTEMARAGIDVAAVLRRHRDAREVRDHEDMLRRFGLGQERLVTRQPTPFEGMRTLANARSVYSLAQTRESAVPESPLPPLPPLPVPELAYLARKPLPAAPGGDKGKKEKDKDGIFAGLMLKRAGSAREREQREWREKFPKIGKPVASGRNLTTARSRSVRSPPRDPALVQLPRESAEIERPNPGWI
ncbi:uncharacterized protein F4807DRAFT_467522 [Annulohypoxylon truncatum]|uniref:uncharacterized protein n=1 Tax=Annulohypoxylon truncatum TaxID=327061 RepID=UPI00200883F1|nr:uncharacterized protein F4807DRAFT_467522 [Annulohypoxylon truncatum]KAI1209609.1 hypothetical protein F4807DRAFT_467522 [Annulohypoxylon truncatum]